MEFLNRIQLKKYFASNCAFSIVDDIRAIYCLFSTVGWCARVCSQLRMESKKRLDNKSIQFHSLPLFNTLCTFLFGLFKKNRKKNPQPFRNFRLITVYYCVYLSLTIFVLKQHLKAMFDLVFSFFDFQLCFSLASTWCRCCFRPPFLNS